MNSLLVLVIVCSSMYVITKIVDFAFGHLKDFFLSTQQDEPNSVEEAIGAGIGGLQGVDPFSFQLPHLVNLEGIETNGGEGLVEGLTVLAESMGKIAAQISDGMG